MTTRYTGTYSGDWKQVSAAVKADAGWRCVRCGHRFDDSTGRAVADCTPDCDSARCKAQPIAARGGMHNLTVHHLDNDKSNNAWWNLLSLCNSCHLSIQARVIPERPWLFSHSPWFVPYVCGFYAHYYASEYITRGQAEADPDKWLRLNPAIAGAVALQGEAARG